MLQPAKNESRWVKLKGRYYAKLVRCRKFIKWDIGIQDNFP